MLSTTTLAIRPDQVPQANSAFVMLMRCRLPLFRSLVLVALGVSIAQLADHITNAGAFCDFEDGCDSVTKSDYSKPLGIPLPVIGTAGFIVVFILSLIPRFWAMRLVRVLAILAGLTGLALLLIQLTVLHAVCRLCVIVDCSSMGIAAIAALRLPDPVPASKWRLLGWSMAGSIALLIPICWSAAVVPDEIPEPVKSHWREGEITVVEVSDFECKYCKATDHIAREVLKHHQVHFVRLVCPMPMHANAATAAKAYLAARDQGKGEEMAKLLFDSESLTYDDCLAMAKKLQLDIKRYEQVMKNPDTDTEFERTLKWVRTQGIQLPSIWVQEQLISGVPTPQLLEDAIQNAKPAQLLGK